MCIRDRLCGLDVPQSKLETFSKTGSTFLVKRFDREGSRRIHFASAMTLLGKTDGASAADGSSYLDLAAFIRANGASPRQDLVELWKRIVFSMAVSNTCLLYTSPPAERTSYENPENPERI